MSYVDFIRNKLVIDKPTGLRRFDLGDQLFDFQRDITAWALRRGRAAIFADCGLGKTPMQLIWAKNIPGRVLIVAPLAVSQQTCEEGIKFGVNVQYLERDDRHVPIVITNYERIEAFSPDDFTGIVLDESSILKSYTGKFRTKLIQEWKSVPFRLCATATPAPNDYMELGNHAEFLGVLSRNEMLSMFFVHDGGETQAWRLKKHAQDEFWKWIAQWAVLLRKPSDLGYEDGAFVLPELTVERQVVHAQIKDTGYLFAMPAASLKERITQRKLTTSLRVQAAASLPSNGEPWIFWCNLNQEAEALRRLLPEAIEVRGTEDAKMKEAKLLGFSHGQFKQLITKPSIAGFGMNWQHCARMAFVGLSDSYEQYYQALRRCWRFGQTKPVMAHIVTADTEGAVVENILRKEQDADQMFEAMVKHTKDITSATIRGTRRIVSHYQPRKTLELPNWL